MGKSSKKTVLSSILATLFFVVSLFSFIGCENFLMGSDVKTQLEGEIAYANAPYYTVRVQINEEGSGTIVTPSGDKSAKESDWIDISFRVNNAWKFIKWEAVKRSDPTVSMASYVEFKDIDDVETKVRLLKGTNDLLIRPVCEQKLYLIEKSPSVGSVANRDSTISLQFNQQIDKECDLSKITITINGDDATSYFKTPEIIGGDTISFFSNPQKLIPVTDNNVLVSVSVPTSIYYTTKSGNIYLESEESFSYYVSSATNQKTAIKFNLSDTQADAGTLKVNEVTNNGEQKEYSIGEKINLQFTKSDLYYFKGWEVKVNNPEYVEGDESNPKELSVSSTKIKVEYPEGTEETLGYDSTRGYYVATITILDSVSNVIIRPVCTLIPTSNVSFEFVNEDDGTLRVNNRTVELGVETTYKESSEIEVQFKKGEKYYFKGWKIVQPNKNYNPKGENTLSNQKEYVLDSTNVVITYPQGLEANYGYDESKGTYSATIKIVKAVDNIVIRPECIVIPTVKVQFDFADENSGTLKVNGVTAASGTFIEIPENSKVTLTYKKNDTHEWPSSGAYWGFLNGDGDLVNVNGKLTLSYPDNNNTYGFDKDNNIATMELSVGDLTESISEIATLKILPTLIPSVYVIFNNPEEEDAGKLKVNGLSSNSSKTSYLKGEKITATFEVYNYYWANWTCSDATLVTITEKEYDSSTKISTVEVEVKGNLANNNAYVYVTPLVSTIPSTSLTIKQPLSEDEALTGVLKVNDVTVTAETNGNPIRCQEDQEVKISFKKNADYEWALNNGSRWTINNNKVVKVLSEENDEDLSTLVVSILKKDDTNTADYASAIIQPSIKKIPTAEIQFHIESETSGALRVNGSQKENDYKLTLKRDETFTVTFKKDSSYAWGKDSDGKDLCFVLENAENVIHLIDSIEIDEATGTASATYKVVKNDEGNNDTIIKPNVTKIPVASVHFVLDSAESGTLRINDISNTGDTYSFKKGDEFKVTFKMDDSYYSELNLNTTAGATNLWNISDPSAFTVKLADYNEDTKTATITLVAINNSDTTVQIKPVVEKIKTVKIKIDGAHGKLTPSKGTYTKKIGTTTGEVIPLSFESDREYGFIKWIIKDNTGNELDPSYYELKTEQEENATLKLNEINLLIKNLPGYASSYDNYMISITPVIAEKPDVIYALPNYSAQGIYPGSRIQVLFDHNMDPGSIYYSDDEIRELLTEKNIKETALLTTDGKRFSFTNSLNQTEGKVYGYQLGDNHFFKNISITNLSTDVNIAKYYMAPYFESPNKLIIKAKQDDLQANTQIYVNIENGFYYSQEEVPVNLVTTKKWNYLTNEVTTDNTAPVITPTFYYTSSKNQIENTAVLANNLDYKNISEGKLWLNLSVTDSGVGLSQQFDIILKRIVNENYEDCSETESRLSINYSRGQETNDAGFGTSAKPAVISLESIPDGVYEISVEATDLAENTGTSANSYYFLKDTKAPELDLNISTKIQENPEICVNMNSDIADVDFDSYEIKLLNNDGTLVETKDKKTDKTKSNYSFKTNLSKGTDYKICVTTEDKIGNKKTFEYPCSTLPNAVSNIVATPDDSANSVSLTWDKPTGNYNGVNIYYIDEDNNENKITITSNATTYNLTNLKYGEEYNIKIAAKDSNDYESFVKPMVTKRVIVPYVDKDEHQLKATTTDTTITLNWEKPEGKYAGTRVFFSNTEILENFDRSEAKEYGKALADSKKTPTPIPISPDSIYYKDFEYVDTEIVTATISELINAKKYYFRVFNYSEYDSTEGLTGSFNTNSSIINRNSAPWMPRKNTMSIGTTTKSITFKYYLPGETYATNKVVDGTIDNIEKIRLYYVKNTSVAGNFTTSYVYSKNTYIDFPIDDVANGTAHTATLNNLDQGYKYNVIACTVDSEGNISNFTDTDYSCCYPDAAKNIKATSNGNKLTITWDAPTEHCLGYKVFWSDTQANLNDPNTIYSKASNSGLLKVRSFTTTELEYGKNYYYKVVSLADYYESYGTSSSVMTSYTAPNKPASVTAVSGDSKITLNWTNGEGNFTGVRIYYGTSSSSLTSYKDVDDNNTVDITGLSVGKKYYFKVYGTYTEGTNKTISTETVTLSKNTMPPKPSRSGTLPGTDYGKGSVTENWSTINSTTYPTVEKIRVYYSTSDVAITSSTPYIDFEKDSSGVLPQKGILSLTKGYRYYFRICTVDDEGNISQPSSSDWTSYRPNNVTNVTATADSSNKITLKWTPVSSGGCGGYKVYYGTTSGATTYSSELLSKTTNTFTTEALNDGTKYYFTIKSYLDNYNQESYSNSTTITKNTLPQSGIKMSGLPASTTNPLTISWTLPSVTSTIAGVRIFYSTTSGFNVNTCSDYVDAVKDSSGIPTSKVVTVPKGYQWFYKLCTYDDEGNLSAVSNQDWTVTKPNLPTITASANGLKITLNWTAPEGGCDHYKIYYGTSSSNLSSNSGNLASSVKTYSITATSAATYYYKFECYGVGSNAGSYPTTSEIKSIKVGVASPTITSTTGLKLQNLNWTLPSDTSNIKNIYLVYKRFTGSTIPTITNDDIKFVPPAGTNAATIGSAASNVIIGNALSSTLTSREVLGYGSDAYSGYAYKVAVVTLSNNNEVSNITSSNQIYYRTAPNTPTNFKGAVVPATRKIQVTWTKPSGYLTFYRVYYSTNKSLVTGATSSSTKYSQGTGTGVLNYRDISSSSTSYVFEGLDASQTWYFKIISWTSPNGTYTDSTASSVVTVAPLMLVKDLKVTTSGGKYNLSWTNPTDTYSSVRIYYCYNGTSEDITSTALNLLSDCNDNSTMTRLGSALDTSKLYYVDVGTGTTKYSITLNTGYYWNFKVVAYKTVSSEMVEGTSTEIITH